MCYSNTSSSVLTFSRPAYPYDYGVLCTFFAPIVHLYNAQCMFNFKARYVEITHSHQISIFQSSNDCTFAVQIIVSAAVLKLGNFNRERINHKCTQSSCHHHQNTGSAIPHRSKRALGL